MRKNWKDFYATNEEMEAMEKDLFVVFEEDPEGKKHYDLQLAVFTDLDVAKEYAVWMEDKEKLYVARFKDYSEGNYDYL